MIYLLTGNKTERKDYIHELCKQHGVNVEHVQNFYSENFKEIDFENIVSSNIGLFGDRECFVIHDSVRDLKIKDILKKYSETEHILIFSENSILKKDLTSFEKVEANIKQFEPEQKITSEKYNIFVLADLLGRRDKKNLWLGFRDAISHVSPEEIHGILFWQLKNLALVKTSDLNPGMNPFVYKKNQSFVKNYTLEEIQNLSVEMTQIFHKRDTYRTLEIDLEKLILSL